MNVPKAEIIKNWSGYPSKLDGLIPYVKRRNFRVDTNISMGGEAPKDFIKEYIPGVCRRKKPSKWVPYIAKVGHKWYPVESITEQLFTDIGELLGFHMAETKLRLVNGQLRLMSKYFLRDNERLKHGAEIFATFVTDKELVEYIERINQSREHFTLRFILDSFENVYPEDYLTLFPELLKMLLFDAITGNNDRHFYNWGVVEDMKAKNRPVFSPIL